MHPFSKLVQIVAGPAQKGNHLLQLRQFQLHHIPVDSDFAEIRRHILCAELRHLLFDHFTLLRGNAELELSFPFSFCHRQRSGTSRFTGDGVSAVLMFSSFFRTDGLRWRSGWSRFSSFWMNAKIPFRSLSAENDRDLNGSSANSRSWSLVEARIRKSGESCAMKCVPLGLFGSRSDCRRRSRRAASA